MKKETIRTLRERRHRRIRAKVSGTAERPRLAVFRSLRGMSAQVIDDVAGKTLAAASWKDLKMEKHRNTVAEAEAVGKLAAERCLEKKIASVVFDRAGYRFHGKVKALADGAIAGGLKI